MPTRPKMTAREVAAELDRINKQLEGPYASKEEYTRLAKDQERLKKEYNRLNNENAQLRAQSRNPQPGSGVLGSNGGRGTQPNPGSAVLGSNGGRGNVKPETKPQPPKEVEVGNKRDPNANKSKGPQFPIPQPQQGRFRPTIAVNPIPPSGGPRQNDATSALIDFAVGGNDLLPDQIKNNSFLRPYLRTQSQIARGVLNGFARSTPAADIVNTIAKEFFGYKPAAQPGLLSGPTVSNEQIATMLQGLVSALATNTAGIAATHAMLQAISREQDLARVGLETVIANTAVVPAIVPLIAAVQQKLGAANFTLQNQAATLIKQKLPGLDVAQVMKTSRLAEPKLENLNAAQVTKAANLTVQKLSILDATQLMNTSRLAEKKWSILDATQLMNTSRLAEKKWSILDATQLMQTSRLAEKKWNILDATQLMGTSRLAEKKWNIIDATELMKDTRQIPAIFQQLQKPLKLPAEIARKSDIAAIKFPTIPSDLARKSDIKTVTIPSDLARKSDIANIRFPSVPAPIVNIPAPDIGGIVQAVNQTLNQQTTNITNIFNRSYQGLTQANLDQAVGNVNNYTNAVATTVINQVNTHTTRQTAEVNGGIGLVAQKAEAIKTDVGDVAKVLGVPQLKPGLSVKPDAELTAIGVKTDNGNAPGLANNIPQLMMMLAAVPYVRQGLHRLGGSFDTSVMNPQRGKTKITDTLGFQQWSFNQLEERMGMPSTHTLITPGGQTQTKSFRSLEDAIEENNANTIVAMQDLEVIERYVFAVTQDMQKLMQITLQTREDVDVLIDDAGCKTREVKKSHPSHINLTNEQSGASLSGMFQRGRVHYVARVWDDSADKNQKLERMSYDTQIAAMSNKFEFNKTNPELPLQKSRAADKPVNDELWRTYVSTMEEPPEGYISKGNPIPDIKEIKNGNPTNVPKPTNPAKKLGK
jgi:hypothetical protein